MSFVLVRWIEGGARDANPEKRWRNKMTVNMLRYSNGNFGSGYKNNSLIGQPDLNSGCSRTALIL